MFFQISEIIRMGRNHCLEVRKYTGWPPAILMMVLMAPLSGESRVFSRPATTTQDRK